MRAVGAELDVAYVVTGGYQRVGDRLRLTARLVALDSGTVVAGTIADGAVGDLFTLQDRIGADLVAGLTRERIQTSRSTAARLPTPRSPAEGERLETPPAETPASEATGAELPPPSSRVTDTASLTLDPERRFGIAGGGTLSGSVGFPALVPAAPAPPVPPDVIRRNDTGQATLRAVRLDDALSLDGALDERVYQNIPAITDFIQVEPDAGQPATEKTEAWLLFDDTNVYIAARAWDSSPESQWIANEMRRDNFNVAQNEHIAFSIDTFYDRRNSVMFTITPIGGRMDGQFTNERDLNLDWNPIWDVRTGRFEGGWSFEARIPFKSLRYRPGRAPNLGLSDAPAGAVEERDVVHRAARSGTRPTRSPAGIAVTDLGRPRSAAVEEPHRDQAVRDRRRQLGPHEYAGGLERAGGQHGNRPHQIRRDAESHRRLHDQH